MITPEVAAYVVKEYLLPMFESDGKKLVAKKKLKKASERSPEGSPQRQGDAHDEATAKDPA